MLFGTPLSVTIACCVYFVLRLHGVVFSFRKLTSHMAATLLNHSEETFSQVGGAGGGDWRCLDWCCALLCVVFSLRKLTSHMAATLLNHSEETVSQVGGGGGGGRSGLARAAGRRWVGVWVGGRALSLCALCIACMHMKTAPAVRRLEAQLESNNATTAPTTQSRLP